ncbi:uncharacterized protein LOC113295058 [Papaver somniferum]|uniref:uncharacterized protein LOC113295058 n=1 Tax=Papaver somniferum TaxID=3469 RepID=UPI000E6FB66E|nr:uncharacterized protein LOC113295058 [Papaver somniferum]
MKLFDNFMDDWKSLCWSPTVEEYCRRYKQFCTIWSPKYSISVNYVTTTWLDKSKQKFVRAWTDKIKHYNNVATSRVESAHGALKKYFGTSQGSFVTSWYNAHQRFENDFVQIQSDFEDSATRTMHNFSKQPMFQMLLNNVSHLGLRLFNDELKRMDKHGSDTKKCGCVILTTNGLPCAHMLLQFKLSHGFIPLSAIDSFYRQLTTTPPVKDRTTKAFQDLLEIKSIEKVWDASTDTQRAIMQSELGVLGNSKTNYLKEPKVSEVQHGRPTKLQQMKNKTTKRNLSEFELVKNAFNMC